jgi:hypothetical protein
MAHRSRTAASTVGDAEVTAFSQFGEDGIIEYLIRRCDPSPSTFVEIGVGDYGEANTRFLAEHRLWRGLIVDLNPGLARDLARTKLDWRSQVRSTSAFVTRDNVRGIVAPFVATGGLGLLSVDIDGVDDWVLEQLLDFEPALVVAHNALFGLATGTPRRARLLLVACVTAGNNAPSAPTAWATSLPARSPAFRPRRFDTGPPTAR